MDSIKLIDLLITDGEYILKSGAPSSIENWYVRAETTLKNVLGDNWKDFVTWEGANDIEIKSGIGNNRLARSINYIKTSRNLLDDLLPEASPAPANKNKQGKKSPLQIFIVHGHDNVAKLELKNYLQNILDLPEPIILHEKPNHGQTIIEKFEQYASNTTLAFVLLTPDDIFAQPSDSNLNKYRARQNVIFEMGYFLGLLGRKEGQIILLHKGALDIPTDISGLAYIDISNGIEAAGEEIRKEISSLMSKSRRTKRAVDSGDSSR